jgi:DNA replication protein DnaC
MRNFELYLYLLILILKNNFILILKNNFILILKNNFNSFIFNNFIGYNMKSTEQMDFYLKTLTLSRIQEIYVKESENAAKTKSSYQDYLFKLVETEVLSKIDRSINRRIQIAGFPMIRKLEEFDFSYQPKLDEKLIRELANLNFMDDAKNIILLGPPGVGKTHLAVALGIKACIQRKRVEFYSANAIAHLLAANENIGNLKSILERFARIDLLIIDELGYLDLNKINASLFFQLIAKRYEKKSIIITSNKPFEEWGSIFGDDGVAAAIIDRILHHCYPFFINGNSYRMKNLLNI